MLSGRSLPKFHSRAGSIARTMEAAGTSETSVNFYRTTWRNIPEDNRLHACRRENLKAHQFVCMLWTL
jgi:hypothetical protein